MSENGGAKAAMAAWDALQAHQHGHIVAGRSGCTHAAECAHTAATHSISTAAARDTAYEPPKRLRRVLALDGFMADAAQEALLRMSGSAAVVGEGRERVTLGALRRVVDVLGAHAAVLVQPFGCKVD